jgi:tRNA 2-thiouridine synthesizing protein A
MTHDIEIDATGLLCPLPVLKLRKRMTNLNSGSIIKILADDPAAIIDIPHFCNENKHLLLDTRKSLQPTTNENLREYFVKKG